MRWADRLFAFRRLPAWGDPVQVLLWIVGWAIAVGFLVLVAVAIWGFSTLLELGGVAGSSRSFALTALVVSAGSTLVWFGLACWFVSEAYGNWRAGHRHGRQWTILIGILMLSGGAVPVLAPSELEPLPLALLAADVAFGVALLIACLTTKPPAPAATTVDAA